MLIVRGRSLTGIGYFTGSMYIHVHVVKCLPIIKLQALPGAKEGDG